MAGLYFFKDYKFQFEGEMKKLHDGLKLVGRAVTAVFMPQDLI